MFVNLKTGSKLLLAFSLVFLLFVGLAWTADRALRQLHGAQQTLYDRHVFQQQLLQEMRTDFNSNRADLLQILLDPGSESSRQLAIDIEQRSRDYVANVRHLLSLNQTQPELQALLQEIQSIQAEFDQRRRNTLGLLQAGQVEQARAIAVGEQGERVARIRDLSRQAFSRIEREIFELQAQGDATLAQQRNLMIGLGLAALVLIVVLVVRLHRLIAIPLKRLTGWADRIAAGELVRDESLIERHDEVGLLNQAFARMSAYLERLAGQAERIAQGELEIEIKPVSERDLLGNAFERMSRYLAELSESARRIADGDLTLQIEPRSERDAVGSSFRGMVGNLRTLAAELQEGTRVLTGASQEILAMTSQVASGAQETAVSVAEITSTTEELKQTASQASKRARDMTETAQRSAQVALDGRQAVDVTLEHMGQIRDQMQEVAESIVRMSERSQAIADTVASVNDLAEQSNLLGVNASIEAVKVGEVGRGFSVVAQEIKQLAAQSKQATAQVRTLLGDVQKAVNQAVMSAEQGGKAVHKGLQQAQASGEAIRRLADSLQDASASAIQIAASSQQQLVGVDQVVMAMDNIRSASEENAAGTRQAEQAAEKLHELGRSLAAQAAMFRV